MICNNCKKEIESDSVFCPYCGSGQSAQMQEKIMPSDNLESSITKQILSVIYLPIIIYVALILFKISFFDFELLVSELIYLVLVSLVPLYLSIWLKNDFQKGNDGFASKLLGKSSVSMLSIITLCVLWFSVDIYTIFLFPLVLIMFLYLIIGEPTTGKCFGLSVLLGFLLSFLSSALEFSITGSGDLHDLGVLIIYTLFPFFGYQISNILAFVAISKKSRIVETTPSIN